MYELPEDIGDYALDLPPEIENREENVIVLQELNDDTTFEEGVKVLEQLFIDHDKLERNIAKMQGMLKTGVNETTRQMVFEATNFRKYMEKRYLGKTDYGFANETFFYGGDTRQILATESEESNNVFVKIWRAITKAIDWFIEKWFSLFGVDFNKGTYITNIAEKTDEAIRESNEALAAHVHAQMKIGEAMRESLNEGMEAWKEFKDNLYALYFKKTNSSSDVVARLSTLNEAFEKTNDLMASLIAMQDSIAKGIQSNNVSEALAESIFKHVQAAQDRLPLKKVDLSKYRVSAQLRNMNEAGSVSAIGGFSAGSLFCLGTNPVTRSFHFEFISYANRDDLKKDGIVSLDITPESILDQDWTSRNKEYRILETISKKFNSDMDKIRSHYKGNMEKFTTSEDDSVSKELKQKILDLEKGISMALPAFGKAVASVTRTFKITEDTLGKAVKEVKKELKNAEAKVEAAEGKESTAATESFTEETPFEEGLLILESMLNDRDELFNRILRLKEAQRSGADGKTRQMVAESALFRKQLETRYFGKSAHIVVNESIYNGDMRQVLAIESEESSNVFVKIWNAIKNAFEWLIDKIAGFFGGSGSSVSSEKSNQILQDKHEKTKEAVEEATEVKTKFERDVNGRARSQQLMATLNRQSRRTIERVTAKHMSFTEEINPKDFPQKARDLIHNYSLINTNLSLLLAIKQAVSDVYQNQTFNGLDFNVIYKDIQIELRNLGGKNIDLEKYNCSINLKNLASSGDIGFMSGFTNGDCLCLAYSAENGRFLYEFISPKDKEKLIPVALDYNNFMDATNESRDSEYRKLYKENTEFTKNIRSIKDNFDKNDAKLSKLIDMTFEEMDKSSTKAGLDDVQKGQRSFIKMLASLERDVVSSITGMTKAASSINMFFRAYEDAIAAMARDLKDTFKNDDVSKGEE